MKINLTYVNIFVGALVFAVLAFLFNIIRNNNPQQETWLFKKTHEIILANEHLNHNLLRYQFGNTNNFNDISANSEQLKRFKNDLMQDEFAVKQLHDAKLNSLFDALELKLNEKEQQVNEFYLANTTLKKAIDFTRRQINALPKTTQTLKQLEQELNYASTNYITSNNSNLQSLTAELKESVTQFPSSQQFFVEQVATQTEAIIEKNASIFKMLNEITQETRNSFTQEFEDALHNFFEERQKITFYIQSFLFLASIVSSAWAVYLLLKLSKKESALTTAESNIKNLQYAFDQHAIISFSDAAGNFTHVNE